jgi:outer membrane immunogenic protein
MRRYTLTLLATAAALGLAMQLAAAADLPRKAPVYQPPPPPPADWSGVYLGLEGGYGWGHENTAGLFPWNADPGDLIKNGTCINVVGAGECAEGSTAVEAAFAGLGLALGPLGLPNTAITSTKQNGWLFGGFAGVQKQWGQWVFGLETDVDGADLKGHSAATNATTSAEHHAGCAGFDTGCDPFTATNSVALANKIDMLGSLRGKVGWVIAPQWMIYGTGGLGWAHEKSAIAQSNSISFCDEGFIAGVCSNPGDEGSALIVSSVARAAASGTTIFGWTAGAGVDWKFSQDAGSAWILGLEYLHYGFGDHTQTFQTTAPGVVGAIIGTPGNTFALTSNSHVDTIKGRISYMFSIH